MQLDLVPILLDRAHFGPEAHFVLKFPVERLRQEVHAADDRLHVDVEAAQFFAQRLDERVVQVALDEVHDRVELDRALAEALVAQELVERVLVVELDDLGPGGLTVVLDHLFQVGDRGLPQVVGRAAVL